MLRLAPLLLVVTLLGSAQTGCSDGCTGDCGAPGVYVSWGDVDPTEAARYRICFDGGCFPAEPSGFADDQGEGEPILVGGRSTPEGRVDVRFEAVAADGTVLARFEGEGEEAGRCCSAVFVRVVAPDRLEPFLPD